MQVDTTFKDVFYTAVRIVRTDNNGRWTVLPDGSSDYVYGPHIWHKRLQDKYTLHPVIEAIVKQGVRPINWQLLLLEWPHVSAEDDLQIAYTRDDRKGVDDVQTRTSIGKYLARHWAHIADHTRRDWAEAYGSHKFELWDTEEKIICGIELGPQSCMKSSYGNIPFSDEDNHHLCAWFGGDTTMPVSWSDHPYAVYAPEYGWRMAVRLDPGKPDIVLGRGLVNENGMHFVRTYKRGEYDHSNSGTDERLEAWLVKQGYSRRSCWRDGLRLRKIQHPTDRSVFMAPYIDGGQQRVSDCGKHLALDEEGDYLCNNTDGTPEESSRRESTGECDDCGDTVYEDDDSRIWAGRHEDRLVGGECGCARHYTWVHGSETHSRYYVHENNVVSVRGTDYNENDLPDEIHELHDGALEHEDHCVWVETCSAYYRYDEVVQCQTDDEYYPEGSDELVEIDDKYYRADDENVVKCYDDENRLKEDCWESPLGNWHSNDYDPITVEAGEYSADELRNIADENE